MTPPARSDPELGHRDARIALICNEGYQSSLAAATVARFGLADVTDVIGGYSAWRAAGLAVRPASNLSTKALNAPPSRAPRFARPGTATTPPPPRQQLRDPQRERPSRRVRPPERTTDNSPRRQCCSSTNAGPARYAIAWRPTPPIRPLRERNTPARGRLVCGRRSRVGQISATRESRRLPAAGRARPSSSTASASPTQSRRLPLAQGRRATGQFAPWRPQASRRAPTRHDDRLQPACPRAGTRRASISRAAAPGPPRSGGRQDPGCTLGSRPRDAQWAG